MVLTIIPLALNALTCITVWMSNLSVLAKIIITIILVAKFGTYFYIALMDSSECVKSFGLIACAIVNVLLAVFFVWKTAWLAIPGCAILTILAIVWGSISGFSFKKED